MSKYQLKKVTRETFAHLLEDSIDVEKKIEIFADLCRMNTLYSIRRAGSGHIGSSFSAMDIVAALHLDELDLSDNPKDIYSKDIYYSSKGHDVPGLYNVLAAIGKLEFDQIDKLRRVDGLPGHPHIETPFIATNTGSLGMGVSKAKGFAFAKKKLGHKGRVFVLTGDGELQEGQFWESLPGVVNQNLSEITIIVDHNKVQSDTFVKDVLDLGDLDAKFNAYGFFTQRIDGNNISDIRNALATIKNQDRPSVIIADTLKGAGVSFMEHTADLNDENKYYRYHSGAPSVEDYQKAIGELKTRVESRWAKFSDYYTEESFEVELPAAQNFNMKLVKKYEEVILQQAEKNPKLVALDADLVLDTGLIPLSEKRPEQFVECGIAEMDMASQAGAMALAGLTPICHSFACFLTPRANEQIYNNQSEKTKVMYMGFLAGLLPAGPGHSHQSIRDIGIMRCNPDLKVFQPVNERQLEEGMDYLINSEKSSNYTRVCSIPWNLPKELETLGLPEVGRGTFVGQKRSKTLVISYGPTLATQSYLACQALEKENKIVDFCVFPWLNQLDSDWIGKEMTQYEKLIVIDDHYLEGGFGELFAKEVTQLEQLQSFSIKAIEDVPACGTHDEVLKVHSLDIDSLKQFIGARV